MKYTAGKPQAAQFHVEEGDYKLRVINAKDKKSSTGNDMTELHLRVIHSDGTEGPALFDYLAYTPSARWKSDAFLQSCGTHPGEGKEVDVPAEEMIGWECEATLSVEAFEGKKRNKVVAYLFDDSF